MICRNIEIKKNHRKNSCGILKLSRISSLDRGGSINFRSSSIASSPACFHFSVTSINSAFSAWCFSSAASLSRFFSTSAFNDSRSRFSIFCSSSSDDSRCFFAANSSFFLLMTAFFSVVLGEENDELSLGVVLTELLLVEAEEGVN